MEAPALRIVHCDLTDLQLILPHIADQFLWNKLIHKSGIGPLGFPIKKFTSARFEEKVLELLEY